MNSITIKMIKAIVTMAHLRVMLFSVMMMFFAGWAQANGMSVSNANANANVGGKSVTPNINANSPRRDWGNEWPDDGLWSAPDGPTHRVDNPLGSTFTFRGFGRSDTTAFRVKIRTLIPGESWSYPREETLNVLEVGFNIFEVGVKESTTWSPGTIVELQYKPMEGSQIATNWTEPKQFRMTAKPKPGVWRYPASNTDHARPDNVFQIGGSSSSVAGEADATAAGAGVNRVTVSSISNGQTAVQQSRDIAPLAVGANFTFDITDSNNWKPGDTIDVKFYVWRDGIASDASETRRFQMTFPAPDRVDWISPANGSEYVPSNGNPLKISGKTNPGVDKVGVWWKEVDTAGGGTYEALFDTTLDTNNKFDVPIVGSINWKENTTYQVQFKVISGKNHSSWSNVRQFHVPFAAPTRLEWVSPDADSLFNPSGGKPLTISGRTDPGVNQINIWWCSENHFVCAQTLFQDIPVVGSDGIFNNVPIPESMGWKEGKRYLVKFFAKKAGVESLASVERRFRTARPVPKIIDWISPVINSAYIPSAGNPLRISAKTEPGVTQVTVFSKLQGSDDSFGISNMVDVTLNGSNIFENIAVPDSVNWKQRNSYQVRISVTRDGISSETINRNIYVPYVAQRLDWISPSTVDSAYAPLEGSPLYISGKTDPGVTHVIVRWKLKGGEYDGEPTTRVVLNSENIFEGVEVPGSQNWKVGQIYEVQYKVMVDSYTSTNWSLPRTIHAAPPQPVWISPDADSWHSPSSENPLIIVGKTMPGVDQINVSWCTEDRKSCDQTLYQAIPEVGGDGIVRFPLVNSNVWKNGTTYDVQFLVKKNGAASVASVERRFQIDTVAPEVTRLQQSMSADGNYALSGTVTDENSGLGPDGDGKNALTIRWRTDSKREWSGPTQVDVLPSNAFSFGLTSAQLDKNWTVEVEISATDRVGNINKQRVFYAEPAVIKLDVMRTNWESATTDRKGNVHEPQQSNALVTSVSKASHPVTSAGSEMFAGDTFVYSITVSGEKGKAANLNIHYTLPDELERNGVPVLTLGNPGTIALNPDWRGTKNQSQMLAEGGHLNAKETLNIRVPVRIKWDAITAPKSHIGVTAEGMEDPGYDDVIVLVPYQGELKLVKRVDKESASEGDTLSYAITFSNTSNAFIVMEEIQDPVDPRMTLEDLSCGDDIPTGIICAVKASDTAAIWEFTGNLPSGASGSVKYRATISKPR